MQRGDTLYQPPVKRSIAIAGHQTSITLEPLFWEALEQAAGKAGLPLNALVARIDAARLEAADPPISPAPSAVGYSRTSPALRLDR